MVIELLEAYLGIGQEVLITLGKLADDSLGGIVVGGLDHKLGIVVRRQLRRIGDVESWRRHADKGGDTGDSRVGKQNFLQRVGGHLGLLHRGRGVEIHLDSETVALGFG